MGAARAEATVLTVRWNGGIEFFLLSALSTWGSGGSELPFGQWVLVCRCWCGLVSIMGVQACARVRNNAIRHSVLRRIKTYVQEHDHALGGFSVFQIGPRHSDTWRTSCLLSSSTKCMVCCPTKDEGWPRLTGFKIPRTVCEERSCLSTSNSALGACRRRVILWGDGCQTYESHNLQRT